MQLDPIPVFVEPTPQDDTVPQNLMKTLEVGLNTYDSAIDDENMPLLITDEIDSEAELDMKLYANIDPLSPSHLALNVS